MSNGRPVPSNRLARFILALAFGMYLLWDSWVYIDYRWRALDPIPTHLWHELLEPSAGFYLVGYSWGLLRWRWRKGGW